MNSKIYLDMDGVLADFDGGLFRDYGIKNCIKNYGTDWEDKTEEQKKIALAVLEVMTLRDFWRNLPVMKGAVDLWDSFRDPYVLTALPGQGYDDMIILEKKAWVDRVFGAKAADRVITCLRSEKVKYAKNSDYSDDFKIGYNFSPNLLIDDLDRNCQEWRKAGGTAILYQSAKQVINELKGNRIDVV